MSASSNGNILIVDDEPNAIKVLSAILSQEGYTVHESRDVDSAAEIVGSQDIDAVISDLKMPGRDGMQFFDGLSKSHPDIPFIFLTAYGNVDSAVSAMTRGAFYYFIKPPDYQQLKGILARAVEQRRLKKEISDLRRMLPQGENQYRIIGNSPVMLKIFETITAIKDSRTSVLICGETGTGKELIARALHNNSIRKDMPFVTVNCAAIPRELLESELFGFEKGAFTGASSRKIGRFEEASGGTLFLDEIGELPLPLQAKLLRVLQEREVERLGSSRKINVDFRLVCSTNRNLQNEVRLQNFRADLFYRINVVQIDVPLLRERKDDIPLLVREFVNEFCSREKDRHLTVSEEAMEILLKHPWPGNVRQLRNVVERAVVLARGNRITLRDLPGEFRHSQRKPGSSHPEKTLKQLEVQAVAEALKNSEGNKTRAAKTLGISRKALYKRLRDANLT